MNMISKRIVLDSSVLVEKAKGTRPGLFDALVGRLDYEKCIGSVVLSEFAFHLLAVEGGKSPRTLKENHRLAALLTANPPDVLLRTFTFLPDSELTISLYVRFMSAYNLLPNDALILTLCQLNGITQLASYDRADFEYACSCEGIRLVSRPDEMEVSVT